MIKHYKFMVKRISQFELFKRLIEVAFYSKSIKIKFSTSLDGYTFYASISYKKLNFISSDLTEKALKYRANHILEVGIDIDYYVCIDDGKVSLVVYQSFKHD